MNIEPNHFDQLRLEASRLEAELQSATTSGDQRRLRDLARRYRTVNDILALYERQSHLRRQLTEAEQAVADPTDPELQAMAAAEVTQLQADLVQAEEQLRLALTPTEPNDEKAALVEIRGGAGGDEAGLFAGQLFRMYSRYAERRGWKTNLVSSSPTGIGGLKEVIFTIDGDGVYGRMKFESGVHRVQRVPDTEKSGRVHTSTVTVAVIPEAEEEDLVLDPKDIKVETSTARGHGGQSVNTTYSAIRLTHLPTGIMVSMQDERSQTQNRLRAMQILRSRVLAKEEEERRQRDSALRKSQIGSGDRSEKIRTYNFPQDRITDHRLKSSRYAVAGILDGNLDDLLDQLRQASQAPVPPSL